MLLHAIAPSRDFTQIANALVWDEELSDSAFRLLVRALALGSAKARTTTVTALTAGLTGGRITSDRARRQLARAGLLHTTKWRDPAGQMRTESLVSSVPLSAAEAQRLFGEHFHDRRDRRPGAGKRTCGAADGRASGTDLPEVTPGENTSPLPVPSETTGTEEELERTATPTATAPKLAAAERVLLELRRSDPRLLLGAREARTLAPLAAEWLARGVSSAALHEALTAGLPARVKSPAALLRWRLEGKMPGEPAAPAEPPTGLATCHGCERAFRPVSGERRCRACRTEAATTRAAARTAARTDSRADRATADGTPRRVDWRALVAEVRTATAG
ncbi:hypothetical protein [Kitasatospora sp. NPDC092286]|uniref:hypothetical protein n=1 Tax=Kitasatospora sp. NPDC092286 TaxID=3364087 RepID=UPI003808309B